MFLLNHHQHRFVRDCFRLYLIRSKIVIIQFHTDHNWCTIATFLMLSCKEWFLFKKWQNKFLCTLCQKMIRLPSFFQHFFCFPIMFCFNVIFIFIICMYVYYACVYVCVLCMSIYVCICIVYCVCVFVCCVCMCVCDVCGRVYSTVI